MKILYNHFVPERLIHMGMVHIWVEARQEVESIASNFYRIFHNTYERYNMERIMWEIKEKIK